MTHKSAGPFVGFALGMSLACTAIGCANRQGKQAAPPPEDPAPIVAEEIAPTMSPSALQKSLAEIAPTAAKPPAAMQKRIDGAVESYLQRIHTNRIYLALDKPIYQPGETIWFRTWELGTPDLLPATRSGLGMSFQLVSPKGATVVQKRVEIKDGVARNDFRLPPGVPGGEYKIRVTSDTGTQIERSVIVSSYQPPRIKKKLEFVRKAYGAGDKVSAALALHRATGEPLQSSTVTAIASVDDAEIARLPITTSAEGKALVKFELPGYIARGDGLFTVLVEDGGVTESIQKRIPITMDRIKFALYPEGGDLITGLPGRVYFAAKTLIDKPADIQGRVLDDQNQVVASFASFHDGMGRFELTPDKGRSYRVQITRPLGIKETFTLPPARAAGCSMQALDDFASRRGDVRVAVWCTKSRTVIATATLRERKIATQTVAVAKNKPAVIALPSPSWDQGVVRLTLFSDRGAPLAERLVYRGRGADMKVKVATDRKSYAPRDRVALTIETSDLDGKPVAADLAVAVVDDTVLSYADDKTANLLAKTYLEYEMPGQKIEEPNFYFSKDPKAPPALDLLLGTAGWRRFQWREVLTPDTPDEKWTPERGFHTYNAPRAPGRMKRARAKAAKPARRLRVLRRHATPDEREAPMATHRGPTTLFAQPATTGVLKGVVRDEKGKPLPGVTVMAQSKVGNRQSSTVSDAQGRYSFANLAPGMYTVSFHYQGVAQSRAVSIRMGRATMLDGRIDTTQIMPVTSAAEPEEPMAAAEIAPRRAERRRRRPARRPSPKAMPAAAMPEPPPPPAQQPVMDRPVLPDGFRQKGPMVGGNRKNLADGDWAMAGEKIPDGLENRLGWAVVREFPAPTYDTRYDGPRTDFRETIHWAPLVRTGEDGKATVEFYLSDAVTSFRATVEGVSTAGRPGRGEVLVQSKLPISLTAKLPLEVSAGDRIKLPVTITNETTRPYTAAVNSDFGSAFKIAGGPPRRVKLAGGERQSFFYDLEVIGNGRRPSDGRIALAVEASHLKDEIEKVIDVVPLGFPQEISLSGTVGGKAGAKVAHKALLAGALPGTIKASLTMYPSPLATMTKGTEAIIREPHGCFEQASSSNYPNIMVLSYLESHEAADPELVTRTHGLLERGYRMLTGYESPKRGYEWFGGDPGHEALTAYGLMEFADMTKVYEDVDTSMVQRTAAWLKRRRDGKGGYQRNSRALDSFGRASDEVTNGYITWALSEARASGLDTELEYQRNIAKTTTDPYLMALAAGTMANLDPGSAATAAALVKLSGMSNSEGVYAGADHSITRSGGIALDIETTSLAVMALLSADQKYLESVRKSIKWLDKQRSGFGGYGSTQSTILALKALTKYAAASRQTRSSGVASLYINGKKAGEVAYEAGHKEALEFDDVSPLLRPGENQIEVRLQSKDPLPYSMAIEYRSKMPASSRDAKVAVATKLAKNKVPWGEGVKMRVSVRNLSSEGVPMTLARVGLPGGLSFQTWQLKELRDKKLIDFYETRDREVILYFRSLGPEVAKNIDLDLLATVPGTYIAPASSAYLYYTDEYKHWAEPVRVSVMKK